MTSILEKIVKHKKLEIEQARNRISLEQVRRTASDAPPPLDFLAALKRPGVSLIAEVKKASPSKGLILEDFDPPTIAKSYEAGGASCISVLTDEHFFQGHLDYLRAVRAAVGIPILRKDFILDPYQVLEARAAGADAVLLIAECLEPRQMKELHEQIIELGMTPLVELYDAVNVDAVLACQPSLVGINNRDLNNFEIDLQHTVRMRTRIPADILLVGESGIFTRQDVLILENAGVDAILVGESLMRSDDIKLATRELVGR